MRILGIDPGYAIVGYGLVDFNGGKFSVAGFGAITTPADMPFPERLKNIYDDMSYIIQKYKPDSLAIERLYFNTNTTTAIDVAQARVLHKFKVKDCLTAIFYFLYFFIISLLKTY